ncbi:MAG: DUF814 domain-containing protein [Desulfovibrionales bacterium]|nr:MAG: DUF814 domain-containing protein [Desulfovibrionales bacterium]
MEALLFRHVMDEIRPMLVGRRLERIYAPQPGWWTFRLQPSDHPRFLLFSHHPSAVALMLASEAPRNPDHPTSQVMRLRKQVQGRRIQELHSDWVHRCLYLGLGHGEAPVWLSLDARHGVSVINRIQNCPPPHTSGIRGLPPDKSATGTRPKECVWPSWEEIRSNPNIWQTHPHISPLLRHTLDVLAEEQGRSLLDDLRSGGPPEGYYVYRAVSQARKPLIATPWPLPDRVRQNQVEQVCSSALEAARHLAEELFFFRQSAPGASHPNALEHKRMVRLRRNLEADEHRLRGYIQLAAQAEMVRHHLYQLPLQQLTPRSKVEKLILTDTQGQTIELGLDPRVTILENMQRWFRLAEKGRRGLVHVQHRRESLEKKLLEAQGESLPHGDRDAQPTRPLQPNSTSGNRNKKERSLPLHRFLSSDGFVLLRGKNQKANHQLLTKLASPFDFWFHAANGPGAHLILKRDTPYQDVPDRSLEQAAALAGLASHFAAAGQASIICAQVKHVRPVKGTPGMAIVDRVLKTLHVPLDPDLENKLRIAS